jgi:hypothetical protein
MRRSILAVAVLSLLTASACGGQEEEPAAIPSPTEVEETPEVTGTFELQGRILETLASVQATQASPGQSPTPTGTRAASPTGSPTGSPTSPTASPTGSPTEGGAIQRGAPGSMSIRLTSFSAEGSSCIFQQGDTVVVAFTKETSFTPTNLTEVERFPRNLRETNVTVSGTVVEAENCILSADSVTVQTQASPTGTAAGGRTSPSPTRTGSPSPTAT